MPAHRKNIEVHKMSGATAKNPQRFRDRQAAAKPTAELGKAPKHLSPDEKKAWKEIASIIPPGVLANTDRIALEIGSRLLVKFRSGELAKASEVSCLLSLLARFGMTPADRNKIGTTQPDKPKQEQDEWTAVTKLRRPRNSVREGSGDWEDSGVEVDPSRVQ